MITRRNLTAVGVSLGLCIVAVGCIALVQHLSERPEAHRLSHDAPSPDLGRGKVVLSLSSAMVRLAAAPPGEPLRVESTFDPDVYTLAQQYREGDQNDWSYRLDFHEKTVLHISVIGVWLGKRSPEVTVLIPPDLPFDLEAEMAGGYMVVDFANLALSNADVELNRGVLQITVSDPMDVPMERLSVRGRIGTMFLDRLGDASPATLDVRHRLGASRIDLRGSWRADSNIDLRVAFGVGELRLPSNVRIRGLARQLEPPAEREIPRPTLRIGTRSDLGNIRVSE